MFIGNNEEQNNLQIERQTDNTGEFNDDNFVNIDQHLRGLVVNDEEENDSDNFLYLYGKSNGMVT